MNMHSSQYDAIIVGAGLAGLTAAVNLQQSGLHVLVVEKNPRTGGLCGTYLLDNYEFVIGCNDYCEKVYKILEELNIKVKFKKSRMKFYVEDNVFEFPPTLLTWFKLLRYPIDLIRTLIYLKKGVKKTETLGSFVDKNIKNHTLAEFIKSFAYPYGMAPQDLSLNQLNEEFSEKYQYHYQKPLVPCGSPQDITDAMIEKLKSLGGKLILNANCQEIVNDQGVKKVMTTKGEFVAKYVLTTTGRYELYPKHFKAGLCISKFAVAVKKQLRFPEGFHTIVYYKDNISEWLTQLDQGILPEKFGFHIFPHIPAIETDYYSLNIWFYLPRGMNSLSTEQIDKIKKYIFNKTEELIPGFLDNIIYSRFVSVDDFAALHGLSSSVSPIIDPTFVKPAIYDESKDIYYIGNSVYPPGNHSGATMLSGMLASNEVKRHCFSNHGSCSY